MGAIEQRQNLAMATYSPLQHGHSVKWGYGTKAQYRPKKPLRWNGIAFYSHTGRAGGIRKGSISLRTGVS